MTFTLSPPPPIHLTGSTRVHRTALAELAAALALPGPEALEVRQTDRPASSAGAPSRGLLLSLVAETAATADLVRHGLIDLHNVDPAVDAFELLIDGGWLIILGTTPRGLLQGVYELHEALLEHGPALPEGFHSAGRFHIPRRIFHQCFMSPWPGSRAEVRSISRLGATHCLVNHDWHPNRNFQAFVRSPIFPEAFDGPTVEANHRGLRRVIEDAADFGLEPALWLTELPCQGGPWVPEGTRQQFLSRYPREVLSDTGTYQGLGLCFGHERVREFYADLVVRFFADFPQVGTLFVFNVDSGGEFCDPLACPRCRGVSKFEQRDRLIRFLIERGEAARPGLRVLTTGWGWDHQAEEFLRRQAALPAASGLYLAAQTDGWQAERQSHAALREARRICRERGQLFIGYDNLHWGDDAAHMLAAPRQARDLQDYPLGVGAKIRRWHELEVDGIFDHWGGWPEDVSCNSLACRAFFLNPLADAETVCGQIARKQFGPTAGPRVLAAWRSLERAQRILSAATTWAPWQWPNWYQGRALAPVPGELVAWDPAKLVTEAMRPKAATGFTYNAGDLPARMHGVGEAWRIAAPHLASASEHLRSAIAAAESAVDADRPVGHAHWWNGEPPVPTRRDHLARQRIYVDNQLAFGREIGLHFELLGRWLGVNRDERAYVATAGETLAELAAACEAAAAQIDALPLGEARAHNPGPWAKLYREKRRRIEAFLTGRREG